MKKSLFYTLAILLMSCALHAADDGDGKDGVRVSFTIGSNTAIGTLFDTDVSKAFAAMLPLTVTMGDLSNREKFTYLPTSLPDGGVKQNTFEVGDIAYWPPGPGLGVFYRHDGKNIRGEVVMLGKVHSGMEYFQNAEGRFEVTINVISH